MHLDTDRLQTTLTDAAGTPIRVTHDQWTHDTTDAAEDLADAGILDTTHSTVHRIQCHANTDDPIAELTFTRFADDETAYISDLHVAPAYRGQGVGSTLRHAIVTALEPRTIYSYPTNDTIRHITETHGFTPAPDLDGWYVKR